MEMIESDMPVTFLGYGLLTDTGGPGRQRGGLGLWREWRMNCAMAQLSTNLDRFKFHPFGLAGGEPAAPSALYLTRDGQTQALRSKVTNMMLKSGISFGSKLPAAAASAKPDCGRGSLSSAMSSSAT
jgi:N-methylhydantoinase B/oxoprolinase/acetone carboxylase alpha subunit